MKKKLIILAVILRICAHAQPPSKFYTKFGGNGEDIGYSAKQTLDGHYIIAGSTSSYGAGNTDVYLVKLDSMGLAIWMKNIGGFGNDVGKSVIQLADSGFVVAGFTNSFGAGGYDAYLLRTDKNGNLIWQTTFGGLDWDFANDLVQAADGSVVVVGNTSSFGSGKKDGIVLKYDLLGNLIWQKIIGGVENEELRSIIKTNDGFLATVGYTESKNDVNGDGYFLKLDLNGDTLFTRTFGGPYKDYANDVVQKASGDYVMAGAKTYSLNGYTESLMFSISIIGDSLWERHLLKTNEDECFQSVTNSSTLSYITAFTRSITFPGLKKQGQIFTAYPAGGFEYQINEAGGYDDEYEYSIESTRDGGYISVGSTLSFGSVGKDVWFIKRDSVVLYYSSIISVKEIESSYKPIVFSQAHSLILKFQEENIAFVEVSDLYGRVIERFYTPKQTLEIETSNYSSSVYLVMFRFNNGQTYYKKFIVK